MPTDLDIIQNVLGDVLPEAENKQLTPRSGTIKASQSCVTKATEALAAFNELDGPGWLQEAGTREILHGDARELNALPSTPWPVAGERASADGTTSLHLRRTSGGWTITRLEDAGSPDGVLLTQRLLSADLKQHLVYHVAYRPENIGSHQELRPFASRFVRFEAVATETASVPEPSTL
jgi:hypothetical protein